MLTVYAETVSNGAEATDETSDADTEKAEGTVQFAAMTDTVYAEGYKADVWKEGKPEKVSNFGTFTVSQPDENGKVTVTGTAKYVSGFKAFNSTVAEERSGYYVAWQFSLTPQENGNLDSVKIYHQSGEQYKCVEAKNLDTISDGTEKGTYFGCLTIPSIFPA